MAKCLRCGAGNEWIEGDARKSPRSESSAPPTGYLSWSTETPTAPGWYFFRQGEHVDVCRVSKFDIDENTFRFGKQGTEWAGPIPEPRDR